MYSTRCQITPITSSIFNLPYTCSQLINVILPPHAKPSLASQQLRLPTEGTHTVLKPIRFTQRPSCLRLRGTVLIRQRHHWSVCRFCRRSSLLDNELFWKTANGNQLPRNEQSSQSWSFPSTWCKLNFQSAAWKGYILRPRPEEGILPSRPRRCQSTIDFIRHTQRHFQFRRLPLGLSTTTKIFTRLPSKCFGDLQMYSLSVRHPCSYY